MKLPAHSLKKQNWRQRWTNFWICAWKSSSEPTPSTCSSDNTTAASTAYNMNAISAGHLYSQWGTVLLSYQKAVIKEGKSRNQQTDFFYSATQTTFYKHNPSAVHFLSSRLNLGTVNSLPDFGRNTTATWNSINYDSPFMAPSEGDQIEQQSTTANCDDSIFCFRGQPTPRD